MRIALVTEGAYPYVTGGVSTWCAQLIGGLDEHTFDVVAITATGAERPKLDLPPNVTGLTTVPLWAYGRRRGAPKAARSAPVLATLRSFLRPLVDPRLDQQQFELALRHLHLHARDGDLRPVLQTDEASALLAQVWAGAGREPMTVYEALAAMELLEHSLRPLGAEPVTADVVHTVSNGLPALVALVAKWTAGTPIVMSEHGVYLRERYLAFHTVSCAWPVKAVLMGFFSRLTRTAYAAADVIVPVNVYNRRWEVEHGADPDSIVTAFNGVEEADFPVAVDEPARPTIVWVGRVDPLKDLETLLRAMPDVLAEVPQATLRLFGPVPAVNRRYADRLRSVADELDLGEAVVFEGPVSPVTAAYHAGHVVVLSSISEGLPYTVIEAMMCGRATVSTEVGGVPELVGDAGLLVPARNSPALAQALVQVLGDIDLRARLASRARARAMRYFRVEQMLATFRGIYADAVPEQQPEESGWSGVVSA